MFMLSKTSLIQTFQFLRYRVPLVLKLEQYIEIFSYHLTMYHHATLIWTPVSRRKIIEKQKSDLQESDSSDSEIIQIKTKTIRANQNYSDDSSSSSNTNEHDIAFFQNEFQSSENIGDSTEEARWQQRFIEYYTYQ